MARKTRQIQGSSVVGVGLGLTLVSADKRIALTFSPWVVDTGFGLDHIGPVILTIFTVIWGTKRDVLLDQYLRESNLVWLEYREVYRPLRGPIFSSLHGCTCACHRARFISPIKTIFTLFIAQVKCGALNHLKNSSDSEIQNMFIVAYACE